MINSLRMKNTTILCGQLYRRRLHGRLGVALVCVLLCACGQSGDLYLPPDAPAESPDRPK